MQNKQILWFILLMADKMEKKAENAGWWYSEP